MESISVGDKVTLKAIPGFEVIVSSVLSKSIVVTWMNKEGDIKSGEGNINLFRK